MVKMVLGSSDTQASSVGTLADNYKAGFEQLVKSIDQLANEDRLSGSAYSNIKNYGSSVVKPLAQAFVLLAEAAKADIKKLPDEYRASVGNEDLDEETLTAQIHALNSTLATNRATKTAMKRIDSAADTQSFDQAISADEGTKRDLEEKLRKLREYNAKSSGFFSDIAGLESAVNTGLSQLQSGISGFNGTFTLPSKKELAWTKTIKTQWEKREAYLAAAAKVNKGDKLTDKDAKAIKAYQKAHPNIKLDKTTKAALDDHKASRKLLTKAEEAHKKGKIDDKTYQSIKSGLVQFGANYVKELINAKITDKAVETFTKSAVEWFTHNINATQIGHSAALVGGGTTTLASDFNPIWAQFARGAVKYGVKYGIPIVGSLVDFGMQKASGENTGDALIKTGAHVGIGYGAGVAGAKVGATIGMFAGGPVGAVVGGIAGTVIGAAGSMAFDAVYDNKEKIADSLVTTTKKATKAVEDVADKVGDAVSDFGKTLGGVFG